LVLNIQESVVGNGFFLAGFGSGEASDTNLKMNLVFIRPPCSTALGTVMVCALLVVGCKKEKTTIAPIQTIEVTAVKVEPHDVPITFEWVAQTESSRQVEIRARVEGILEKRVYKEGAVV
jgi:membrane fusion protein (multidrug efflux system)